MANFKIPINFLREVYFPKEPRDPILELGRNWAYALNSPAYLFHIQALYVAFSLL